MKRLLKILDLILEVGDFLLWTVFGYVSAQWLIVWGVPPELILFVSCMVIGFIVALYWDQILAWATQRRKPS